MDYSELVKRIHSQAVYLPEKFSKNAELLDVLMKAADAIEELSKPKWISVEDALPEEDVEVLISYRYKEGEGDTSHVDIDITTYGQMYFGGREVAGVKHWRPPFEYFSSNYEVIAWMPLPEPPKEETE